MRTLGSTISATAVGIILSTHVVDGAPSREAFHYVFIMGAAVVLVGVVIALFIPRRLANYDTSSIPVQN